MNLLSRNSQRNPLHLIWHETCNVNEKPAEESDWRNGGIKGA